MKQAYFLGPNDVVADDLAWPSGALRSHWPRSRRTTPAGWIKENIARPKKLRETEVLHETDLWNLRHYPWTRLSHRQRLWMPLLPPLVSEAEPVVLEHVDELDLWQLETLKKLTVERNCVVVTRRADIVVDCHLVHFVLAKDRVLAVDWEEIERLAGPEELWIEAHDGSNVKAIVDPFAIEVREEAEGWYVRAADGQALAARLITHGYGGVEAVVIRKRPDAELLRLAYDRLASGSASLTNNDQTSSLVKPKDKARISEGSKP